MASHMRRRLSQDILQQYHGGELLTDGVNLERAGLRVESMQTYGIVSSIVMGSSIGLLDLAISFKHPNDDNDADEMVSTMKSTAASLFVVIQFLSLLCSAYTTVIFTLMALYYSTSLGMGADECYQAFDTETKAMRIRAFIAFVASIVLLMSSFAICIYLFFDGIKGLVMTAIYAILVSLAVYDFSRVIKSAGRYIFEPLTKPKSTLEKLASERRLVGPGKRNSLDLVSEGDDCMV